MRRTLTICCGLIVFAATFGMIAVPATAQECRGCARKASIAACMKCVAEPKNGGWDAANAKVWCGRNQPVCAKR